MKVLVVAAHPDDEVLGCGGTISRLSQEGSEVTIAILGSGMTAPYPKPEEAEPSILEDLYSNSRQAAQILGAKDLLQYKLPDNRFDTIPLLDVIKIVEKWVDLISPEIIYSHHPGDLNIDHVIVHRAVLTATRPMPGQRVREVYSFEIPSSTDWAFNHGETLFRPNVFCDISTTLDKKLQALSLYKTETRNPPHPRSRKAIQNMARRWGSIVGCQAAEAFELIRAIR
jgi:LmbE family N-acetylglucosaminyl deacetylase